MCQKFWHSGIFLYITGNPLVSSLLQVDLSSEANLGMSRVVHWHWFRLEDIVHLALSILSLTSEGIDENSFERQAEASRSLENDLT